MVPTAAPKGEEAVFVPSTLMRRIPTQLKIRPYVTFRSNGCAVKSLILLAVIMTLTRLDVHCHWNV